MSKFRKNTTILTKTGHEWKRLDLSHNNHYFLNLTQGLIIWVKWASKYQRKIWTQLPKLLQCRNTFSPVPWSHQILWPLDHRSYIFNFGHFRSPLFSAQEDPSRVMVFRWWMDSSTAWLSKKIDCCPEHHWKLVKSHFHWTWCELALLRFGTFNTTPQLKSSHNFADQFLLRNHVEGVISFDMSCFV